MWTGRMLEFFPLKHIGRFHSNAYWDMMMSKEKNMTVMWMLTTMMKMLLKIWNGNKAFKRFSRWVPVSYSSAVRSHTPTHVELCQTKCTIYCPLHNYTCTGTCILLNSLFGIRWLYLWQGIKQSFLTNGLLKVFWAYWQVLMTHFLLFTLGFNG